MGTVVELAEWRRKASRAAGLSATAAGGGRPAAASALEATDPLDRLERAVARLDLLVRQAAASLSRVEPLVHTEVLAIIGALAIEEVAEAATRAENLVTWISGSMT